MAGRGNSTRCPGCGRFGSVELDGYCKACYPGNIIEEVNLEPKEQITEVCIKCGELAYKFLEKGPYHSWYCEKHYNEKLQELEEPAQSMIRDNPKPTNPFFKDEFVPYADKVGLIKDRYGVEI